LEDIDKKIAAVEAHSFLPKWVRQDKIQKIQLLPIFPQVHEWVLHAVPPTEIARRIQDHGLMVDEEIDTIIGYIGHYRATVPPAAILARQRPQDIAKVYRRMVPMKTYIEELDDMISGQLAEVKKAKMMAEQSVMPIGVYGDEMERFIRILQNVSRLRKESGLTDKDIQQYEAQDPFHFDFDKAYGREGITALMKDPKSRVKILGTVERLFDLIKRKKEKGEDFAFEQIIDVPNNVKPEEVKPAESQPPSSPPPQEEVQVIQQIDLSTLGPDDFKTEP